MGIIRDLSGKGYPPSARDAKALLPIVRLAYEGIERRESWIEMLIRICGLFSGQDAALIRMPLDEPSSPIFLFSGIDPTLLATFEKVWAFPPRNPALTAALRRGIEGVQLTEDVISYREVERTEYFEVFRKPRRVRWEIGGESFFERDSRRYITVNRHRCQPRFGRREIGLMRVIAPHVIEALRSQARIEVDRRRYRSLNLALENLPDGVFTIESRGALRPLNPAAEQFLRQEKIVELRPLTLQQPASELTQVVEDILRFEQLIAGSSEASNPMRLERVVTLPSGRRYRADGSLRFENGLVVNAILQVRPAPEELRLDRSVLERKWGLTRREITVAQALVAGQRSDQICRNLSISHDTLKTHLRHLFEKTYSQSRPELVAQLLRSATMF